MSLLDNPTDVILLYPETQTTDGDGNPVRLPGSRPVRVEGRVQALNPRQFAAADEQQVTIRRFLCRKFPAGRWAKVTWDGRSWDVWGEPVRRGSTPQVAHAEVLLRARDPEVL